MFFVSRFKDVEKREYECEVVTPLFLGGADPKKVELRVPPFKAAMRFWWRALYDGNDVVKWLSGKRKSSVQQKSNLLLPYSSTLKA